MQYVFCPLMKLVSETFLKNLNKFNCESWQSQFKLEYFLWTPFIFVDADAGLAVKTRGCDIFAKLSQAKPQLQLSWLALASLNFT